jgi:hypothetical protein
MSDPSKALVEKLRRSRRTLERQIEEGDSSFDSREALKRLAELEKHNDDLPNDSLIERGDA